MAEPVAPIVPASPQTPAEAPERWEFDPRMWKALPAAMLSLAIDKGVKPADRVKAAAVLADLHEQNEKARTQTIAQGKGEETGGARIVRIDVDAEALRAAFLGRLVAPSDAGGPAGPAEPHRVTRTRRPAG